LISLSRIIHVGRNKVAQHVAGTAQTQSTDMALRFQSDCRKATVVPERAAFARSGLQMLDFAIVIEAKQTGQAGKPDVQEGALPNQANASW